MFSIFDHLTGGKRSDIWGAVCTDEAGCAKLAARGNGGGGGCIGFCNVLGMGRMQLRRPVRMWNRVSNVF